MKCVESRPMHRDGHPFARCAKQVSKDHDWVRADMRPTRISSSTAATQETLKAHLLQERRWDSTSLARLSSVSFVAITDP